MDILRLASLSHEKDDSKTGLVDATAQAAISSNPWATENTAQQLPNLMRNVNLWDQEDGELDLQQNIANAVLDDDDIGSDDDEEDLSELSSLGNDSPSKASDASGLLKDANDGPTYVPAPAGRAAIGVPVNIITYNDDGEDADNEPPQTKKKTKKQRAEERRKREEEKQRRAKIKRERQRRNRKEKKEREKRDKLVKAEYGTLALLKPKPKAPEPAPSPEEPAQQKAKPPAISIQRPENFKERTIKNEFGDGERAKGQPPNPKRKNRRRNKQQQPQQVQQRPNGAAPFPGGHPSRQHQHGRMPARGFPPRGYPPNHYDYDPTALRATSTAFVPAAAPIPSAPLPQSYLRPGGGEFVPSNPPGRAASAGPPAQLKLSAQSSEFVPSFRTKVELSLKERGSKAGAAVNNT
mmetsp:Transcript_17229/g.39463  ORF Transcript_17229/g.39463 Transcript_17229/m.39463 type:complete len:408 (+) Transcript_17229:118-1341(+)